MKELANEGVVESGLPFLNDGHFKTAIVGSFAPKYTGCHVPANSVGQARLVQVVHW